MKKLIGLTALITISLFITIAGCSKKSSTPPTQAMLYLAQSCGGGPVSVTVNGVTKTITPITNGTIPNCGDANTATFSLSAGSYAYDASDSNGTWSDSFTVVANQCNKIPMKCLVLTGNVGNPRFNLQFTNPSNVDLDLHVFSPDGTEIYYANPSGQGGQLDVDCLCGTCPNGPNENIYWQNGTAPHGTYKYKVVYYGDCGITGSSSTYTLRLVQNSSVIHTYTGTLSSTGSESPTYTFVY